MLIDTEALQGTLPNTEALECALGKDVEYVYPRVEEETLVFTTIAKVSEEGELIVWKK